MSSLQLGFDGELHVAQYLQQHGFTVCSKNYRKFFGEIDIIARKKDLYIFVEVKTRKSNLIPLGQLISKPKQNKIIKTAQTFISEQQLSNIICRFDVALVTKNHDGNFTLEYIENAFTQQSLGNYDY